MPSTPESASRIKLAILLPSLQVGGAERLVLEELAYLRNDPRFSFEVHLVFDEGPLFASLASLGVPTHVWNAPHKSIRMLKTYANIVRYLRKNGCDILHSHLLDGIGPIVGKLAGSRVVATVHSDTHYGFIERLVLTRSDLVLGCGKQVMRNICGFVPAERAKVLSNAVRSLDNECLHRNGVFKQFGITEGSRLVVSLGRLTRAKGFDVLIEAFGMVVENTPNAVLVIGGDGEEKNALDMLVESARLGVHVKLPGVINDIDSILTSCDLYVNSSRWEGLPMTLLEAMAHEKPMVATRVGGNPEVVLDGVTGILVPPEDPGALARAIIRMLKDDQFRKSAAIAAKDLFTREYTIERHCEALKEHYLRVFKGKPA